MKDINRIATFKDFIGELTAIYRRTSQPITKVNSSADIAKFIKPYFDEIMDDHEEVKIIHLNNNNMVVNVHHHSVGGVRGTIVDMPLVLRQALLIHTVNIIMVHNHPSGVLKASAADIEMSKTLRQGCASVGLYLLDSIIVTRESYFWQMRGYYNPFFLFCSYTKTSKILFLK